MKIKWLVIFCALSIQELKLLSQLPDQAKNYLPKILPPSPEAASIAKFGNYEVNMYSGLPNISIPLYEIQVGELKVPVSLSYHASGIKVSDLSPWVGTGWSLSAGGTISRRVMGRPDELQGGYLTGSNPVRQESTIDQLSATDLNYLKNVVTGYYDVEPDIYSYNVPGKSGKFLFNQPNNYSPIIMPFDPIDITRTQTGLSTQVFSITDESGIQYKFDTYEWTVSGSSGLVNNDAASTWLLTKMISSNKQDTITFTYTARSGSGTTDFSTSETFVINDNTSNQISPPVYTGDLGTYYASTTYSTTTWQINNEIVFKNGKIVFEQAPESREDLAAGVDAPKRLKSIKIYAFDNTNNTYKLVRVIRFYHSYFVSAIDQSKRLKLDSLAIMNPQETEAQKYRFDYNTSQSLPGRSSLSKDYWGYFNNAGNNSLIPRMQISWVNDVGVSSNIWIGSNVTNGREPDPNYMQAYVLNKITYPTGGYTTFEYETNKYQDAQYVSHFAGGLRVKKIKSYDGITTTPVVKTYKYGASESGYGRPNFILSNYFFQNEQYNWFWQSPGMGYPPQVVAVKRVRTYFSNPTIDIEPFDGSPVTYATVTEYIGDETTNSGKTTYQFNDHADGMNVVGGYGKPIITSYHFNRGQLIQKDVYKFNPGNSFAKVATTTNTYEAFPQQWNSYQGLVVLKWRNNDNTGPYCDPQCCGNSGCYDSYAYRFANYSIRTGDNKLTQTTETAYDPTDVNKNVTTTTNYYYDNFNHQQVTRIQTTNSEGETILITKKYPHEYPGTSPYTSMVTAHIFNKVIEDKTSNNGVQKTLLKNNYAYWGNNNYLPQTIEFQKGSNSIETRANFLKYDLRANPQEMQKTNDIKQSYIWGYQKIYPIAEITNANESDIAATSFEADGKGNWNYTGLQFTDGSAPTGIKVYNLGTGSITKTVSTAGIYIVSYWSKSGAQNVNSTSSTNGRTISGGWTFYEHKITLGANATVTVSGTGIIDELRLYPEKALMTTMTYFPLVGMTSQCDANNRITYYEYDEFNRLILIRDQDRNVLKKICYNYSGQTENCNIYYNSAQSGNFTRNNCPSGYTGSTVTYTVPANTYSSTVNIADANNKALADVNANGQAYANAIGTCTYNPPMITINGYNTKSSTYRVNFTNNETSSTYSFYLNPNTYYAYYLGQVPAGTYTVQFQPAGSPVYATYNINGYTQYGQYGATFYNISINSTSTASMY